MPSFGCAWGLWSCPAGQQVPFSTLHAAACAPWQPASPDSGRGYNQGPHWYGGPLPGSSAFCCSCLFFAFFLGWAFFFCFGFFLVLLFWSLWLYSYPCFSFFWPLSCDQHLICSSLRSPLFWVTWYATAGQNKMMDKVVPYHKHPEGYCWLRLPGGGDNRVLWHRQLDHGPGSPPPSPFSLVSLGFVVGLWSSSTLQALSWLWHDVSCDLCHAWQPAWRHNYWPCHGPHGGPPCFLPVAFPANPGTAGDARVPYCHLHQVALAKSIPQDAYGKELPPVIYYVIILLYYTIHYEYQWKN